MLSVLGHLGAFSGRSRGDAPEIAGAMAFPARDQNDDGPFRYTPKASRLACITTDVLGALGQLGA